MKVEFVKQFRRGPYMIKHEWWSEESRPREHRTFMKSAYTLDGDYIGSTRTAHLLWKKYGIERFEKTDPKHCVTSVGYSPRTGKWYGWSHRAIHGFKKGQKKRKGNIPNEGREYVIANPRRAAAAFAGEVS